MRPASTRSNALIAVTFLILSALATGAPSAQASALTEGIYYTANSWVGDAPPNSDNSPIQGGAIGQTLTPLMLPGTIQLPYFTIDSQGPTQTVTETNTPFHIQVFLSMTQPAGAWPWYTSELQIDGVLNGTLYGNSRSDVTATVTGVHQVGPGTLPFPIDAFHVDAPQVLTPYDLNSWKWNDGFVNRSATRPLIAEITTVGDPVTVPEPSTIMVFSLGVAASFGWLRKKPRGKKGA